MSNTEEWSLTVQLGDPQTKRIVTESIAFGSRRKAQEQLEPFTAGSILKPNNLYTIENEAGEQIAFIGSHYLSHSLKTVTQIDW